VIGTQAVAPDTYLEGGVAGIVLASYADDEALTPLNVLSDEGRWPGTSCIETVPGRDLFLDAGLTALQVLSRCEAGNRADDVAWFQIAVDTGDRIEVIEVTITSLRDLDALSQMLASLHVTEAVQ